MSLSQELIEITKNRVYIEPDQTLMPGIIHIGRLDFRSAAKALKPHSHGDALEFCYLQRGVAVFHCGKQKWQLKGGECFISYPDEIHGTGSNPMERMKLYWLGYKPEIIAPWLTGGCLKAEQDEFRRAIGPALPRTFGGSKRMSTALNKAIDAYLGRGRLRSVNIKTSLLNLFLHLADKKNRPELISREMLKVIDHINTSVENSALSGGEPLSLNLCAAIAGVSLSRFKTRFKNETGIPPAEFILRKRIDKAAEMLSEGSGVLDTSIDCGFSSSQYFATVFRRYRNTSPSAWIKQNRNSLIDK